MREGGEPRDDALRIDRAGDRGVGPACQHFLPGGRRRLHRFEGRLRQQQLGLILEHRAEDDRDGDARLIDIVPALEFARVLLVEDRRRTGLQIGECKGDGLDARHVHRGAAHEDVVAVGGDAGDQRGPIRGDELDLDAKVLGQLVGGVNFKTLEAVGRRIADRHRIEIAGGADPQGVGLEDRCEMRFVLCLSDGCGGAAQRQQGKREREDRQTEPFAHDAILVSGGHYAVSRSLRYAKASLKRPRMCSPQVVRG